MAYQLAPEARVGLVALRTNDLATMVGYYTHTVGLKLLKNTGNVAYLGVQPNQQVLITIRQLTDGMTAKQEANIHSFTILVPHLTNLRRIYAQIQHQSHQDYPIVESKYEAAFELTDPDGNEVRLAVNTSSASWEEFQNIDWANLVYHPVKVADFLKKGAKGQPELPSEAEVGYVTLNVRDIAASTQFYSQLLGFVSQQSDELKQAIFVTAENTHRQIRLFTDTNLGPHNVKSVGLDYLNFKLPLPEMIADLDQWLTSQALPHQYSAEGHYLFVSDPDGLAISFSAA